MKIEKEFLKFISSLEVTYNELLSSSFSKKYWKDGEYTNQRIKWTDVDHANRSLKIFNESGVYIWGHNEEPIYIGKAEKQSFKKRFNRYIFGSNSQCKIAKLYFKQINNGGKHLSIEEIGKEYNIDIKKFKSRAIGIKAFGECDSNDIWFILLPFNKEIISGLEISLIKVGEDWNRKKGLKSLINLDK